MGAGRHRLRQLLVIGEFALALTLLTGAGLAIHSFLNLLRVDLGLRTDHVLTFFLPVPDSRPKDPDKIVAYYRQILSRIDAVPGVTSATAMTGLPLFGAGFGMPFTIVGKPAFSDPSMRPLAGFGMVTPDFFQTFGIRLVNGRVFNEQDTASSVKVAVVNEEFVKQYLKGTDPLQQRISVEQLIPGVTKLGPPVDWQIVGVYHNVRAGGLRRERAGDLHSLLADSLAQRRHWSTNGARSGLPWSRALLPRSTRSTRKSPWANRDRWMKCATLFCRTIALR